MVLASPTGLGANPVEIGINAICGAESAIEAAVAANGKIRDGVGTSTFHADTNHAETKQALAKAAALDPSCALCVWAEALSLGSTLNYQVTPEQTAAALVVADRAAKVVKPGDERTAALIHALASELYVLRLGPVAEGDVVFASLRAAALRCGWSVVACPSIPPMPFDAGQSVAGDRETLDGA
eukprot:gene47630-64585_t